MLWTEEDEAKAAKEGWMYRNGYIRAIYNATGAGLYPNTDMVLQWIRNSARDGSEWHKNVFLQLPWTPANDVLAAKEGWRLTFDSIIRTNHCFPSNEAAQQHVLRLAEAGDALAIKALSRLAKNRLTWS